MKIIDFIYSSLCHQYRESNINTPVKKPSCVFVAVCGCYYSILVSVVINPGLQGPYPQVDARVHLGAHFSLSTWWDRNPTGFWALQDWLDDP